MEYLKFLFNTFFIYVIILIIAIFMAIILDFITGIRAAKKRKEPRNSKTMKKTIEKIVLYFACFILLLLADVLICYFQFVYFERVFPFLSSLGVLFILFREIKSIYENVSIKIQKQIKQDAEDFKKILKYLKDNYKEGHDVEP